MRILVSCVHYPVCSGRYFAWALKAQGHNVQTIGPSTGTDIWGMKLDERFAWTPTYTPDFEPELVIVMDSDPTLLDATKELTQFNVPVIVYGVDNHVRYYRRPWFDHYFFGHKTSSICAFDQQSDWLPCGFDRDMFRQSAIELHAKPYDVAMVGVMYPERQLMADRLKEKGLRVFTATGLIYEDYALAYHNALVSVCLSVKHDLAQRVFETAALGCVVVTDPLEDLNLIGRGPIISAEVEDIPDVVLDLVGSGGPFLEDLVNKTVKWAEPHSWEQRAKTMLAIMKDYYHDL